jgi:parvulin-like peptidyl-prolyl isomerase
VKFRENKNSQRDPKGGFRNRRILSFIMCKWRYHNLLIVVLFIFISPFSCGRDKFSPDSPIVESKGRTFISIREFNDTFSDYMKRWAYSDDQSSSLPFEELMKLKMAVLERMIEEKLILQKAREINIDISKEEIDYIWKDIMKDYTEADFDAIRMRESINVNRLMDQIRKEILKMKVINRFLGEKVKVDLEEARIYYEQRKDLYRIPDQVRAGQIVVPSEREAKNIVSQLKKGARFYELAKRYSISPEGKKGGDLGFFGPGQMPNEFDKVVFSLAPGHYSPIVSSPYGYHIFFVYERRKGGIQPFKDVMARVITSLQEEKMRKCYNEWIGEMRKEAEIKINSKLLGHNIRN